MEREAYQRREDRTTIDRRGEIGERASEIEKEKKRQAVGGEREGEGGGRRARGGRRRWRIDPMRDTVSIARSCLHVRSL